MTQPTGERVACHADDGFSAWASTAGGTIALSTYQANKVAFIGWNGVQVSLLMREFQKPMGLDTEFPRLALATRNAIHVFANAPDLAGPYLEDQPGKYDSLFLPRVSFHTNDLNVHDLAFGREGLWIVNTRFSCLATVGELHNFVPRWHPSFVSAVVPEDRCHLNGMAMREGKPTFVTALGKTDDPGAWREGKATGGVLIHVDSNDILLDGLCMPHSPVWHQDRLWFLNSGAGELCLVDLAARKTISVCALPGYLRGLSFVGHYALIGLSKVREKHIFGGLPVQDRYPQLRCGIAIVDTETGINLGLFEFTAGCHELFGVRFLPGLQRANILNLDMPATVQAVTAPDLSYWLRPSSEVPLEGPG